MLEPPSGFSSPISTTTAVVVALGSFISTVFGVIMLFKMPDGGSGHVFAIALIIVAVLALILVALAWLYFNRRDGSDDDMNRPRSLREQLDNLLLRLWPEYQERLDEREGHRWRWLLVLGSEGSGKSSTLSAAGFERVEIPVVRPDGAPATENHLPAQCRWWRHEGQRLIALEIEMNKHGLMEHGRFGRGSWARWRELLKWLRRRRLIDAVIVQVGIDRFKRDLERIDEELRRSSSRGDDRLRTPTELARERMQRLGQYQLDRGLPGPMRAAVDTIRYELLADIPIYLVFSHCDTMAGFLGFFNDPGPEPWGLSLLPPERAQLRPAGPARQLGDLVANELAGLRLDLETRAIRNMTCGDAHAAATALVLPSEFGAYADAIRCFIELFANLRMQQRGLAGFWNAMFRPSSPLWLCNAYLCAAGPKSESRDWLSAPRLLVNAGIRRIADIGTRASSGDYFVGFFGDIAAGLQQNTWIRLPRPLFAGLIPFCLVSAVLAFSVGRFYHKELEWLRNLEVLSLRLQATNACEEDAAVRTRAQLISAISEPIATSFPSLRQTAQEKLRQNIEQRCLLPRLKRLADERLKAMGSGDCASVLPEKQESSRLAVSAFQLVAILNHGLNDSCNPLSAKAGDLDKVAQGLYDIEVPTHLDQKQKGALKEQLVYYFKSASNDRRDKTAELPGSTGGSESRTAPNASSPEEPRPYLKVEPEIIKQASCVANRLRAAPPENIYRIWSGKGLAGGFYTDKSCREFAQILEPRWLSCIYESNKSQGDGSPARLKSPTSKIEEDYKTGYSAYWKDFIRNRLWTFPKLTERSGSEAWLHVCKSPERSRHYATEYWNLESAEVKEVWKQLYDALRIYRERMLQLAQAVAEPGESEALPPICLDSERDWRSLQAFWPKHASHDAVNKYMAALDGLLKQLTPGIEANAKTQATFANYYVSQTLAGGGLTELVRAREALLPSDSDLQKMAEGIEAPMKGLEKDVWLVLLRLSAQDIGQGWEDPYSLYQQAIAIKPGPVPADTKAIYDVHVSNLKEALKGWEDKLKVFCSGNQPVRTCRADPPKYGARLRLADDVPAMFRNYDHVRVDKTPEPQILASAPPIAASPQVPVPTAPSLPSLRPLRIESLNCVETAKQSLLFVNYPPNAKPGPPPQLVCDRHDEKTWLCPTTTTTAFPGEGTLALFSLMPNHREGSQELLIQRGHFDVADKCKAKQIRTTGEKERYTLDIQTDHPMASCRPASGVQMDLRITFAGHCSSANAPPAPSAASVPKDKEVVRMPKLPPLPACPLVLEIE